METSADQWAHVWSSKHFDEVSWFQADSSTCRQLVQRVSGPSERIALVGVGASRLVDELISQGYSSITAIDLSQAALDQLRERLGDRTHGIRFVVADVRELSFDVPVDVWHDRATFHFLTDSSDQVAYAVRAAAAVRTDGHLILATFSPNGPAQCSGLDVIRHTAESLINVFGPAFEIVDSFEETHLTPWASEQAFLYALFRRTSESFDGQIARRPGDRPETR
jgi:ubiquinone/menaquinone biosynthesis C-methylase UbiE